MPAGEVNLSTLTSVRAEYDSTAQRLLLTVPGTGSPRGSRRSANRTRIASRTMAAALLNYDVYTNHSEHTGGRASVWHEFRYFNEDYSFSSTGYARQNFTGNSGQQEGYVRYDSTFLITNEEDATTDRRGRHQRCAELEHQRAHGRDQLRARLLLCPDLVTGRCRRFPARRLSRPRSISLLMATVPAPPAFSRGRLPSPICRISTVPGMRCWLPLMRWVVR